MAEEYSVSDIVNSIKLEYPIFKDIEVSDKRNKGMSDNRQLEYYSKEDSPTGKERVDIFNPNLQGEELKNAIFGDMLHSAPSKSKEYADKKLQLINSRTPEQIEIDKEAYNIAIKQGEKRPFDKWFKISRSDAFIRGYLANQWEDTYYTEEQKELMNSMVQSLRNKSGMNEGGNVSDQTEKAFSSNPFKGKQTVKRLKNVARNVPILGTAFDVADIASSVATGNLGQAAVDTGLALAGTTPVGRVLSKGAKFIGKKLDKEMISVFPKPERMFPEESRPKGGDYLNPATGEVLSGRNVSSAKLSISPEGKPSFKVANDNVEEVGSVGKGKTQIKTNLFKKKAGWKWIKAPEGMEDIATLISVENKGKHFYTIETNFSKGVNLKKYPNSKTEPRLRPTVVGEIEIGPQIGNISVRGKEHPVYQSIRAFNKGGTTMKDQTEMAFMSEGGSFPDLTGDGKVTKKDILRGRDIDGFEEGGLRDEGGTVDPVSGNDVPSGSNKSEVRDDIPAMLSEGEFVFPADVVRYIGLSKLMELRQEAKMGLKVMEEMGQMGNSEEATLPDDFGIPDIEIIEDDDEELDGMDDDDDENDMDNMTESGRMMVMEKRAQGGVIEAQQGTVVPNQFEQMMGYGAGQGSTRYNPNRVPYTKADGTIVNILEDYMGRPMQDTEGLTRVTPYQAGPVFGGEVQPVQPIQPVLPPMPVDPTDDTAARREQERKDKRKEAKEADRRKALDAQIDKDIINFQDMGDPRFVGKTEKEARDAYYGMDFSERAGMAKQDLGYKASSLIDALPLSRAAKTKAKALVDKKTTTPEQRRKRKRDSEEGVGAFADKSLSREERQKDKIESDAIDKIKDKKEKDKARDKARKRREDRDKAAGKKRVADYKANKDSVRGQGGRAKGGLMKKDYP